jgi:uncharacterized membrane protein
VFLAVGVAAVLAAIRLLAAAASSAYSPYPHLHVPSGHGDRAVLLAVVLGLIVVLILTLTRRDRRRLRLELGDGGSVAMDLAAAQALVRDELGRHPDVLRARPEVTAGGASLRARVWVAARPLVPADQMQRDLTNMTRDGLERATGLPVDDVRVQVKVVAARQLRRYL